MPTEPASGKQEDLSTEQGKRDEDQCISDLHPFYPTLYYVLLANLVGMIIFPTRTEKGDPPKGRPEHKHRSS